MIWDDVATLGNSLFTELLGLVTAFGYIIYILGELLYFLLAPIFYFIHLGGGFIAAVTQNYALASNPIFEDTISDFIAAIPGWSTLALVINAALWVLLILFFFRQIKHI